MTVTSLIIRIRTINNAGLDILGNEIQKYKLSNDKYQMKKIFRQPHLQLDGYVYYLVFIDAYI